MQTGGITSQIPLINQAIEASRSATSSAIRQIDEANAIAGITNTGTANRVRAEALMAGEQRTAQLPTELVQQFINNALGQITRTQQTVVQGYGGAADAQSRMYAANATAPDPLMGILQVGGQALGSYMASKSVTALIPAIAAASAGCWVAAELYGWFTPEWFAARRFIFERWHGPVADAVRAVYLRHGRFIATLVRWALKPLFDAAVERGTQPP